MTPILRTPAVLLLALATACVGATTDRDTASSDTGAASSDTGSADTGDTGPVDADGDGHPEDVDCDDGDAAINPGADEVCNGVDDDCDGDVDDGDDSLTDGTTFYGDADRDGFGDDAATTVACELPPDSAEQGGDCDDANDAINPAADEVCNAGVDDDCDGLADDADDVVVSGTTAFFLDDDGDGFGLTTATVQACVLPEGYALVDGDCDDASASANPGATEVCNAGVDDDCDGTADEPDAADAATWFADDDGDGFGDDAVSQPACVQPSGHVADATDCDDTNDAINPSATEICNGGVDDDCDGDADLDDSDGAVGSSFVVPDDDGDAYGDDSATPREVCAIPTGFVTDTTDCDDTNDAINPSATEICNGGVDDDCDGDADVDDASISDAVTYYADDDADGFGDELDAGTLACTQPSGSVSDNTDCDDTDDAVYPGATEVCNGGVDDDCDGDVDAADSSIDDATRYYGDDDGDGFGDELDPGTLACSQPSGEVDDNTDCDDTDADINPDADEVCNSGVDDDCDGDADDDDADVEGGTEYYEDADGDGYGDSGSFDDFCVQPSGYVTDDTDCDDADKLVHPGRFDFGDRKNNDCDNATDEDVGSEQYTWDDDIASVLSTNCGSCHISSSSGGFQYSGYSGVVGTGSSAYIVPGDLDSELWLRVDGGGMPPGGSMATSTLDMIETWILEGAIEK